MKICFLTLTRGISVWVHLHRNGVHRNLLWKYPKLSTFYPFLRNQEKKADGRTKKMWSDWISLGKVFPCSVPPQTNGETKLLALNIYPLVLVSFLGRTIARCRSLTTPLVSKLHLALSTLGVGSFSIFDRRESPPWIDEPSWPFLGFIQGGKRTLDESLGLVSGIFPPTTLLEQISSNHQLGKFGHLQLELYPRPIGGEVCCISICGKEAAFLFAVRQPVLSKPCCADWKHWHLPYCFFYGKRQQW